MNVFNTFYEFFFFLLLYIFIYSVWNLQDPNFKILCLNVAF